MSRKHRVEAAEGGEAGSAARRPGSLAGALAVGCRRLRAAVEEAGAEVPGWWPSTRGEVEVGRAADALAQGVVVALLWARLEGEAPPQILAGALAVARGLGGQVPAALRAIEATIAGVEREAWQAAGEDPWRAFYEAFLAALDAEGRSEAGAYYTPAEVVRAQVVLVREALARLGRPRGFADPAVRTIDPACGTGTYLQAIVAEAGGAADATRLADSLVAFEIMAGPCAVAHARLTRALAAGGGRLPAAGARVELRDVLAGAEALGPARAGELRVCVGNPPYERPGERLGGARRGGGAALLEGFTPGGRAGRHAKNLHNAYVYFWRWALREVFERAEEGGVVCFVTASSFLRGPGFVAMRRRIRELVDELWIIDVGGDALGPRRSANVFAIRTPVCVALALRFGRTEAGRPAVVQYCRLPEGLDRAGKLALLGGLRGAADLAWRRAPEGWEAPFVPATAGAHERWPRLAGLFPWLHSGAQWKRTWPVGETRALVERRWRALLAAEDRRAAFHESAAWTIDRAGVDLFDPALPLPPLASLAIDAPVPRVMRYAGRALDRRWCLADGRLGDRLRPALWQAHGPRQRYLTTLTGTGLSRGPALVACAELPDLHHFRGSYGDRGVVPLWRDAAGTVPNVTAGLLPALAARLGRAVAAEELFAYVYGCLAQPAYTELLAEALAEPGLWVPLTADAERFARMAALGERLLALHTFAGPVAGAARCVRAIAGRPERFAWAGEELRVGSGAVAPVSAAVWGYEVSGLRVVASWLGFRIRRPRGSSPLDALRPEAWTEALTQELLEVLWALEGSLALHVEQAALLGEVVAGPLIAADELPRPRPEEGAPPRRAPRG